MGYSGEGPARWAAAHARSMAYRQWAGRLRCWLSLCRGCLVWALAGLAHASLILYMILRVLIEFIEPYDSNANIEENP